jgi:hypothetical protein
VPLSETAQRILRRLVIGRNSNLGPLQEALGLETDECQSAIQELAERELVELVGRSRVRRVTPSAGLSDNAQVIFSFLPRDSSSIGNIRLRSLVDLDNESYRAARAELLDAGLVELGRGRGGSVSRAVEQPVEPTVSDTFVRVESDLYAPFRDWLKSSYEGSSYFFDAQITATGRRRPRGSGRWSRPDVTSVLVDRPEWLPQVEVEVSTYEIKPASVAQTIDSVYEAAAHGKQAHKASLVIEGDETTEPLSDEVKATARRFGLGLYRMQKREGEERYDVSEILEPDFQSPEPSLVDRNLGHFFSIAGPEAERHYRSSARL